MKVGTRNSIWYSVGAASSIVVTMCIAEMEGDPPESRVQADYITLALLWAAYFLAAWLFYSLYGCLILKVRNSKAEDIIHFVPLLSGFLYGPIFLAVSFFIFPEDGDPGQLFWLLFIVPPVIGYELVLFTIRIKRK